MQYYIKWNRLEGVLVSYINNSVGEAQWNDFIPQVTILAGGVNAPARTAIPGFTSLDGYGFIGTGVQVNELNTTFEIMHDYQQGTDLSIHIHWCGENNTAGNVRWYVDYVVMPVGSEAPALTTIDVIVANPGLGLNNRAIQTITGVGTITGTGLTIGRIIAMTIRRNPADTSDTYTGRAILLSPGVHYQIDTLGSRQITTK